MQNVVEPTFVAMATNFGLGVEKSRLPACVTHFQSVTKNSHDLVSWCDDVTDESIRCVVKGQRLKVKRYNSSYKHLRVRAAGRHLVYGITQCYLPPDTSECASPNPS